MKIRRNILLQCKGDKLMMKAIAMLLVLKDKAGACSSVRGFSYRRLSGILSVSPTTVKKYVRVWQEKGLVGYVGRDGDILVVRNIKSGTAHRNFDIKSFDLSSFKSAYHSLRAFLALTLQARKEYVRRIIRMATAPKRGEDYKAAIKYCNHHVRRNGNGRLEFVEGGMSYGYMAKRIGFCITTMQRIVRYAVKRKWWTKRTHFIRTYMPGVNRMPVPGYMFTTLNYGFRVSANTYELSSRMYKCLLAAAAPSLGEL